MKILFINSVYKWGSTGNIVYSLAKCLKNKGHDVLVAYGRGKEIKDSQSIKFGYNFETILHALLTRLTGYMGYFSFFSTLKLKRIIKKYKPDIINMHETHSYFLNVPNFFDFIKKMNIPVVFTNHCMFLYTGKCGHSGNCDRYSKKCGSCPHLHDYPKSLFLDKTSDMLEDKIKCFSNWQNICFVSPSSWIDKKMDISFLKSYKRFIVNNGIDTNRFGYKDISYKKELGLPEFNKIVLMVAPHALSKLKGGMFVVELAKHVDNFKFTFVIVGCENLNIIHAPNVILLPPIYDRVLLSKYYNSADLFIVPSLMENYPTTSIEAQCSGLPVIGFDVGGVKETILPGNGCVVPYGDTKSVISALDKYSNSKISKMERSLTAKKFFSEQKMSDEYEKIFKKMIN